MTVLYTPATVDEFRTDLEGALMAANQGKSYRPPATALYGAFSCYREMTQSIGIKGLEKIAQITQDARISPVIVETHPVRDVNAAERSDRVSTTEDLQNAIAILGVYRAVAEWQVRIDEHRTVEKLEGIL